MSCICHNGARVTCPVHGADVNQMLVDTEARHRSAGYADDPSATDKLRELLATRPTVPNEVDLRRWWQTSGDLLGEHFADLRETASAVVELSAECHNRGKQLRLAAPVMLTVIALLADEADIAGLREIGIWYEGQEPDHIKVWLDAEHARVAHANEEAARG